MPKYFKKNIPHQVLYITSFIYKAELPFIVFIHGGPGLNSAALEYLIKNEEVFNTLEYNIILYDQRGCGRSAHSEMTVLHNHNVEDLNELITYLSQVHQLKIACLVGHSYGAKLLYDYYKKYDAQYPGIFLSTADSIITPRVNNLMLDLNYLKRAHPEKYNALYKKINTLNNDNLWKISEELAPVFQKNEDRIYFYWANLICMNKVKEIQSMLNLPINNKVFMSVREDLYSDASNSSVAIPELDIKKKLWINGAQDLVMNSPSSIFSSKHIKTFFNSSHYPHLEEEKEFCQVVNDFISN